MAFWPVRPDIVRDNLARFTARSGIAVAPLEIAGDYAAAIEASFAGDPPDVLYAQRGEAARWAASGLIEPLDDFTETPAILAEMLPLIRESSRDAAGRTIGLTYYNAGPFCLFRNERLLGEIGRAGGADPAAYPQDWDAVLQDARALQRRVAHPMLMRWYDAPTGIPWAFLAECFAEGDNLVDAALNATFAVDTPAADVLARWQTIWREDLAPHDVLDWDDARADAAWMSGAHAYYTSGLSD
jgi:multiple sugar transport system substrate-binding protein